MRRSLPVLLALLACSGAGPRGAFAQDAGLQPTPPSPSSGQPNLPPGAFPKPAPVPYAPAKPDVPVVQQLVGAGSGPLTVRKRNRVARAQRRSHHRVVRASAPVPETLDRPALAGVTLLQPLPPPPPQPHIVVPMPAYPLEAVAAAYLTPPPPIVCHPVPRIRDLPDPRLYRERALDCVPDTP